MSNKASMRNMILAAVETLAFLRKQGYSVNEGAGALAIALTVMTADNELSKEMLDAANDDLTGMLGPGWQERLIESDTEDLLN